MPRVREIDDGRGDAILEELFAKERAIYGDLLNPTKVMAHCPPILRAAKLLGASIAQSGTLPKGLAELVSLRVAAINGCPFWVDINSVRVTDIDGGDQKVADLGGWRESNAFSELERVALEYAERMTHTAEKVDGALFGRLKEHFNEPQIVELTAAIALENFRSKFNPALGVESQGFCILPKR